MFRFVPRDAVTLHQQNGPASPMVPESQFGAWDSSACFVAFTPITQNPYPRRMDHPPQFVADHATAGAVSMDGSMATLEFVADNQRFWVTLPVAQLASIQQLCHELQSLAADAKDNVAQQWHVQISRECVGDQ
jgi:hypothetical protein